MGFYFLWVWEIFRGDFFFEIVMFFGKIYLIKDGNFLNVFCNDGIVKIFCFDCGELYDLIDYKYDDIVKICVLKKYLVFVL